MLLGQNQQQKDDRDAGRRLSYKSITNQSVSPSPNKGSLKGLKDSGSGSIIAGGSSEKTPDHNLQKTPVDLSSNSKPDSTDKTPTPGNPLSKEEQVLCTDFSTQLNTKSIITNTLAQRTRKNTITSQNKDGVLPNATVAETSKSQTPVISGFKSQEVEKEQATASIEIAAKYLSVNRDSETDTQVEIQTNTAVSGNADAIEESKGISSIMEQVNISQNDSEQLLEGGAYEYNTPADDGKDKINRN